MNRTLALTCDIDIEQSWESFHAHAIPEGVEIEAGDIILVHDTGALAGERHTGTRYTGTRRATLTRAGFWRRRWTRFCSIFELAELYEVGFQPIASKAGSQPALSKSGLQPIVSKSGLQPAVSKAGLQPAVAKG